MQCILYQNLFLEGFSYVLQIDMHFICTLMLAKFYSCKKWVLQEKWVKPELEWVPKYYGAGWCSRRQRRVQEMPVAASCWGAHGGTTIEGNW
jgi:hypothetical protein